LFNFDYSLNLEKAHETLPLYASTRYVAWRPITVPPLVRKEHPESWQLWVSPLPYAYPHVMLLRNVKEKGEIELRGFLLEEVADYIYRAVKSFFRPLVEQEIITKKDYEEILSYFKPIIKGLIIRDKGFVFYLPEDWRYSVEVESPPTWLGMGGYGTPLGDYSYGVKLRTIRLLEKARIAENLRKVVGYRWEGLTEDEIKLREDFDRRPLVRNRRLILDDKNAITVDKISETKWKINFSKIKNVLPEKINLKKVVSDLTKVSRLGTSYVDKIELI